MAGVAVAQFASVEGEARVAVAQEAYFLRVKLTGADLEDIGTILAVRWPGSPSLG